MKALVWLASLLLLSSCASTPQSRSIQDNGLGSLPQAVELTDVPFYPQSLYQCGPAALATMLQTRGVQAMPEDLTKQVYLSEREGSLQIEMIVAARRHEMLPYKLKPQLRDLFTEIAAGNPVLVLQNLGLDWYTKWHYAVVIGYDAVRQEVILRSGTTRRWITPFAVFERTWQRADFWAVVIVPVGEIPKTAEPLQYLKTAYAFEETGKPEIALKAYQAANKQWPDAAITWMTLGNMAFDKRDWPEAINAFKAASRLEPASVISWNNLAYALHAYGCGNQAQRALECGLSVEPDNKNLQDSWQELIKSPVSSDQARCPKIEC